MPNNNIFKCKICNKHLIFEEVQFHNHSTEYLDNVMFDTDGTFSLDGKKWYKFSPIENKQYFSPPTESQQRNKTTDDETEPNF